jgi:hypothetical protein
MTMHSHDRYRLLAASALDRDLQPEEQAELDDHLARCASCRADVARMRAEHAALGDLPPVAPDPRVYHAVMAAAQGPRRRMTWSALAVAAVLLLGGLGGAVLAAGALNRPEPSNPAIVVTPSPSSTTESPTDPATVPPTTAPTESAPPTESTPPESPSNPPTGDFDATSIGLGAPVRWVAAGDVDNDGAQDLVASLDVSGRLAVLLGRGDGTLRPPFFIDDAGIAVFDLVDMNGDGDLDVVGGFARNDEVAILEGDGRGGFREVERQAVGNPATPPVIADLDGDGDLDMAVIEEETGVVSLLEGNGKGRLKPARELRTVEGAVSLAGGDLDGDGTVDLVASGDTSRLVTLLLMDPDGGRPAVRSLPVATGAYVPAVGDVDADGDNDIVVVDQVAGLVSLLRGAGAGTFEQPVVLESSHPSRDLPDSPLVRDLDGDKDLELILAATGHDHLDVLRTGPSGLPGRAVAVDTGTGPRNAAAADFDGDGRVDLASANAASTITVLLAR